MFRVIYADPPWDFTTWSDKATKSAKQHYNTMSVDDIARLPVASVTASDALLFLWATWPNLIQAIEVGQAWGFKYKTLGFSWVKLTPKGKLHTGLGYYTRANSEPCLLFTRGHWKQEWIKSRSVHQIHMEDGQLQMFEESIAAQALAHSTKPVIFHERIEALVDGPYLELFGRRKRDGWTVLGNAIDGINICESLRVMSTEN